MRALKASAPDADIDALREYVRDWWKRQRVRKDFNREFVDVWSEAIDVWERVEYAQDDSPLDHQIHEAAEAPVSQELIEKFGSPLPGKLLNICELLQRKNGMQPFWLSSHHGARILKSNPKRIWKLLQMLCREGYLRLVEKGDSFKANRYHLIRKSFSRKGRR